MSKSGFCVVMGEASGHSVVELLKDDRRTSADGDARWRRIRLRSAGAGGINQIQSLRPQLWL